MGMGTADLRGHLQGLQQCGGCPACPRTLQSARGCSNHGFVLVKPEQDVTIRVRDVQLCRAHTTPALRRPVWSERSLQKSGSTTMQHMHSCW